MAVILCTMAAIPVFGSYIISKEVEQNGCDPSGESCYVSLHLVIHQ